MKNSAEEILAASTQMSSTNKSADQSDRNDTEDSECAIPFCSDLAFLQGHSDVFKYEELHLLSHAGAVDDLYLDILSPPFWNDMTMLSRFEPQSSRPNEDMPYAFPSASLEILRHHRSKIGAVNGRKLYGLTKLPPASPSLLSTNHIIELSAGNFIQSNSAISNPYASTFSGLSEEHAKDGQLVQDLLSCAEKVHHQQYDSARKLLEECKKLSLGKMNTIQRLVYYFAEALHDKIDRETGKPKVVILPVKSTDTSTAITVFHKKSPLNQITQFTSIQSVVDHVSDSRKVHVIDLEIYCGLQQMILIQALAARSDQCPIEHLKITAIANHPNHKLDKVGVRLKNLAESLNLDFSFQVISLEELLNPQKSRLVLEPEEAVVVHAAYYLEKLIVKPDQLESLMTVIRSINPRAMIVTETEANVNSPVFVNRFVEALFFYGAYFDCVEDCLKNDVEERTFIESELFSPGISNMVACEGEERVSRIIGINVWREFLARYGMVETELSKSALDHANLVLDMFDCKDSCTLGLNRHCLVLSWKGTPICSVSAWKLRGM